LHFELERCVAQRDCAAVFWQASGTHAGKVMNIPPTGRRVEMRGVSWLKMAGGKIVQGEQLWDVAGMLRAIGLLPDLTG
jgi:predicted ester cyclase